MQHAQRRRPSSLSNGERLEQLAEVAALTGRNAPLFDTAERRVQVGIDAQALRARCRRAATRVDSDVIARLGVASWRSSSANVGGYGFPSCELRFSFWLALGQSRSVARVRPPVRMYAALVRRGRAPRRSWCSRATTSRSRSGTRTRRATISGSRSRSWATSGKRPRTGSCPLRVGSSGK
jgi:hypothetical protein